MRKNVGFAISLFFVVTGCATAPIDSSRAKLVPTERILAYSEPNPDYAKVEIIRDSGHIGSACYFGVMYRNTVLARFGTKEKATFYIPEGNWPFAIVRDPDGRGLCGVNDLNPVFETQKISKEQDNLFRISFGPWRRPRLLPLQ
ncbi:hypothetical protein [Neisseria sp. 83E34]|uniref:hypothetical protein n=1 Tax=Neisseria sp. 83E34 TaxID=1692264 RepID=UPI0006CE7CE2|nr:hypothetical protein [Neisseria sp. 83E34]KPN72453.1 hypothetical protein AKG09_00960 [Neisseria sp. 83E34]